MLEEELRAKLQSEEARRDRSRAQLLKNEELLLEFENRIDHLLFHLHGITVPGQIFVKARDFLEKKMSSDPQNVVVSFEERDSSDDESSKSDDEDDEHVPTREDIKREGQLLIQSKKKASVSRNAPRD
ncbi:uncharacterized protein [Patagioenas fasciata]|uniref:uncharacterized protein isoform X3 n=1 Tax=Patagioenas fasciata TaxID=372321 RepID=UPI003A9911E3